MPNLNRIGPIEPELWQKWSERWNKERKNFYTHFWLSSKNHNFRTEKKIRYAVFTYVLRKARSIQKKINRVFEWAGSWSIWTLKMALSTTATVLPRQSPPSASLGGAADATAYARFMLHKEAINRILFWSENWNK